MLEIKAAVCRRKQVSWHLLGDVKGETGREIITEQDQALKTKYLETQTLQTEHQNKD